MSVNIRNAFGNAEILSGVSSYGVESGNDLAQVDTLNADKQSSIQLNLKKPVNANPDDNIEVSVHKLHQSHLGLMAYQDIVQGISLFRCFANEKSLYKYGYTGVWRENCKLAPNAPLSYLLKIN